MLYLVLNMLTQVETRDPCCGILQLEGIGVLRWVSVSRRWDWGLHVWTQVVAQSWWQRIMFSLESCQINQGLKYQISDITTHNILNRLKYQVIAPMKWSMASYPLAYINKDKVSQDKRMALRRHVLSEEMLFLLHSELFINLVALK